MIFFFFSLWGQTLTSTFSSSPCEFKQQVLLFLHLVMTTTRTILPSDPSRDMWKDGYPQSCLRTLWSLHQCSTLSLRRKCNTNPASPRSSGTLQALWKTAGCSGTPLEWAWTPLHCTAVLAQTTDRANSAAQTSLSAPAYRLWIFHL